MQIPNLFYVFAAAAVVAGCPANAPAQSTSRDLITREDIEKSALRDQDLFTVIRSLRPHFLAPPKSSQAVGRGVAVKGYADGVRETDQRVLKSIPASSVEEVRYQSPSAAMSDHRSEASGGAIVVKRLKPAEDPESSGERAQRSRL